MAILRPRSRIPLDLRQEHDEHLREFRSDVVYDHGVAMGT
jgi:hypothetical protein